MYQDAEAALKASEESLLLETTSISKASAQIEADTPSYQELLEKENAIADSLAGVQAVFVDMGMADPNEAPEDKAARVELLRQNVADRAQGKKRKSAKAPKNAVFVMETVVDPSYLEKEVVLLEARAARVTAESALNKLQRSIVRAEANIVKLQHLMEEQNETLKVAAEARQKGDSSVASVLTFACFHLRLARVYHHP